MNLYQEVSRYEKWLRKNSGGFNSRIDYKYKAFVLNNGLDKTLNKICYSIFCNMHDELFGSLTLNVYDKQSIDCWLQHLYEQYGGCALMESFRLNNARYHRVARLKKRIQSIISYDSWFLTLTFNNNCLDHSSEKSRRQYVHRYLKSLTNNYVANIDYGKKNHREHYHALVQCSEIDKSKWLKHGFLDAEPVYVGLDTPEKLAKYVSKLTNHAIKETNTRCCLIYPKRRFL